MLAETQSGLAALDSSKRIATALFALFFGGCLLYFVGFAHSDLLHNAAHDTRHAIVAPCH